MCIYIEREIYTHIHIHIHIHIYIYIYHNSNDSNRDRPFDDVARDLAAPPLYREVRYQGVFLLMGNPL